MGVYHSVYNTLPISSPGNLPCRQPPTKILLQYPREHGVPVGYEDLVVLLLAHRSPAAGLLSQGMDHLSQGRQGLVDVGTFLQGGRGGGEGR